MRFQGENCTLSFGLYFEAGQVLLNGTVWPRRPASLPVRQQSPRLRFGTHFTESELVALQRWLTTGSTVPLPLPNPMRYLRRLTDRPDSLTHLELELAFDEVPNWWNWDESFPLKINLEIRPNEFDYLTRSLSREYWSTNLTW